MTVTDPPIYASLAARLTDPPTSHGAVPARVGREVVRGRVLNILTRYGPLTHDEIATRYVDQYGRCTPQNIRSRTAELERVGGVRAVDRAGKSPTGKRATRWDIYRDEQPDA